MLIVQRIKDEAVRAEWRREVDSAAVAVISSQIPKLGDGEFITIRRAPWSGEQ